MDDQTDMPALVPINYGICSAADGHNLNLSRQSGGTNYELKFPNSNGTGYMFNTGNGVLSWDDTSSNIGSGSAMLAFISPPPDDYTISLIVSQAVQIAATTSLTNAAPSGTFTMSTNGRLQYNGAESAKYFKIFITICGHTLVNNREIICHVYKTGASVFNVHQTFTKNEHTTFNTTFMVTMSQGDYIDVRLETLIDNINFHLHSFSLVLDPV